MQRENEPMHTLPIVDLAQPEARAVQALRAACREHGFFYLTGHGIDEALGQRLEALSHAFFALPEAVKARYAMALGGRAWRGWFPLGGELTSGRPDWKEGLYLGTELPDTHPRVQAGVPLHGRNLLPGDDVLPAFADTVLTWIDQVTALGQRVLRVMALSLDLPADWFARGWTADPLVLFRIFLYPSRVVPEGVDALWGVGEHTDYGLLTLLRQDDVGGLAVKTPTGWIDAPPLRGSFVCNIGDMLERATGGHYRSTPHRVRLNTSGRDRLSFPLFLDPDFEASVSAIHAPTHDTDADRRERWDGASVHAFEGRYGDYVLAKVGKVFPDLAGRAL